MVIIATLDGERRRVGHGSGRTHEEAVADYRRIYKRLTGDDWSDADQGVLNVFEHVPIYQRYPSI